MHRAIISSPTALGRMAGSHLSRKPSLISFKSSIFWEEKLKAGLEMLTGTQT